MSHDYKVKKHTCEIKYPLLEKYFNAYTLVISNNFPQFFYVDAFAATGKCQEENSGKQVDGSPLIALKLKYPFTDYIFVEVQKKRISLLEKYLKDFHALEAKYTIKEKRDTNKKVNIELVNFDINDYVDELLNKIPNNTPALIFLDPEGLELKWTTVEKFSQKDRIELLINFSVSGIIRNLENPKAKETIQDFLEEDIDNSDPLLILDKYKEKLKKYFKWVVEKPVKTQHRSAIYYLIFATNNRTGFRIMSNVMKTGVQRKLFKK